MLCINKRAQVMSGVERIACFPISQPRQDPLQEGLFHGMMDNQTRGGGTILSHVPKGSIDHMTGHCIEIFSIIKHHAGVFAATFQHNFL